MQNKKKILIIVIASLFVLILFIPQVQFILGGAMINLGYRFQDHVKVGLAHPEKQNPEQLWKSIQRQNKTASVVRTLFPRSTHHPKIAIMICMDARLEDDELLGDSRNLYYVIRTAGSVLPKVEQDMLELAIEKGVEVIVLTTHHDCAAEKASNDPNLSSKLPHLCEAVKDRKKHINEFLERPSIKEKIKNGKLIVMNAHIDPKNGMMIPMNIN